MVHLALDEGGGVEGGSFTRKDLFEISMRFYIHTLTHMVF